MESILGEIHDIFHQYPAGRKIEMIVRQVQAQQIRTRRVGFHFLISEQRRDH